MVHLALQASDMFGTYRLIQISDDKVPMHKFENYKTFEEAKDLPNFGVIVPEPYVVFDFDNEFEFQIVFKIVTDLNINCRVMKSNRGGHIWFKSTTPLTNKVKGSVALTIPVDVKSWGKKSYVRVKHQNKYFEWLRWDDEPDDVPFWLTYIKHSHYLVNSKDGEGRNDILFRYIITLTNGGLNRDQIRSLYKIINDYLFADKLSNAEMGMITRDEAFENIRPAFFERRRFLHDLFSQYLKNDNHIYNKNGRLFMFTNGYYSDDYSNIERRMIDYVPELSRQQRKEVLNYLTLITDKPEGESMYHVVVKNGILDIRDGSLNQFTPDIFVHNKVNGTYDTNAYDEHVDRVLNKLTCNDKDLRLLLEEMIGYCIVPTSKFQKAFILYGGGSNGKSTFLDMVVSLLDEENVSALSLRELNHDFKLSMITSKLANIGDDISDEYMSDSSIFKKLVTGEEIVVNVKNEQPYKVRNTAKLIFAANSLPMTFDKSQGMGRRLNIIPFNAAFSVEDDDYDPFIIDKLTSPNALNYLLRLAVEGIQRVFRQNEFTDVESVNQLITDYNKENNNVLQFIDDFPIVDRVNDEVYSDYSYWCITNGMNAYKKRKFNSEIRSHTKLDLKIERIGGQTKQVWKKQ